MSRNLGVLILCAVTTWTSCERPQPPPSAVRSPVVSVAPPPALPRPSAPAPVSTAAPKTPPPDPNQPALDVLSQLCELGRRSIAGETFVGCTCCPPFKDCPPNNAPPSNDTPPEWVVQSATFGAFSQAGAEEALLGSGFACGENLGNYGRVVLARREGERWHHDRDFIASVERALPVRRADGHSLVAAITATGKNPSYQLELWDLSGARPGAPVRRSELLGWASDAHAGCISGARPGSRVVEVDIVELEPFAPGLRLVLDVHAIMEADPSYRLTCEALNEALLAGKEFDIGKSLPTRRFEMTFRRVGSRFIPGPNVNAFRAFMRQ